MNKGDKIALVLSVILLTFIAVNLWTCLDKNFRKGNDNPQIVNSSTYQFGGYWMPGYEGDDKTYTVTSGPLKDDLEAAVKSWESAIGIRIKTPTLYKREKDWAGCLLAIACADVEHGEITVLDMGNHDPKEVLMHEVGHLLGVPHIDGDPLMSPVELDERLVTPSPAAVALAKHYRVWDSKSFKLKE